MNFGNMVEIKDISDKTRFSTPINKGAKGKFTLMKEDYIILPFSVSEPVYFKLGDYVDLSGVLDDSLGGLMSKKYEIVDLQKPVYNTSTGGYDYQLRLDAYYWKWKNKIFKYTPEQAGSEASWSLTATLDVQLGVFLRNLKALGYTFNGTDFTFSIDSTVENKAIAMTYDNINLLDALFSMAGEDKWNCDCWITDNVIHFGRNEFGDAVKIERGVEASVITRSESRGTYATRIYAFGSTKNIPTNYRPTDEQAVVNGVVQKRLMLPVDTPYIDAYEGMTTEEAIEDVVVFDDVYPRRVGTLSDVHTRTEEVENEDGTKEAVTYYRYKDTGLEFKEEYIIEGQELQITFQSGKLNGMVFGVIFNPEPKDESRGEQLWEIVRNEDYGRPLPDDIIRPENGDEYILSGFDIQLVSDQYIPAAEQELKEKAFKYAEIAKKDDGTYPTTLRSSWVKENLISRTFEFGQRINLVDDTYFENGRLSRVLGWELNIDIPWDSPIYTIGESMPYSRIQEIEDKVDSLTYKGQTYNGNGNGVYIIRTNDSTAPSDSNVFSALRSLATLHRKDKTDINLFLQKFLGGLMSDNIESQDFASGPFGTGFVVKRDAKTGKSYIEADEIYIRLKAYFDTLEIKHLSHVGGRIVLSPASMECNRVEFISGESESLFDNAGSQLLDNLNDPLNAMLEGGEKVYRCYFNSTDGEREIVNEFAIDDLAQCREFNVKENISHNVSNQYYWRRVVGVGSNYIDLSIDDCDSGSMTPKAGDTIVTIGNRTDVNRQHVVFLSSYDEDAPCFKLYSGINSYSMLNKEVTVISPNAEKNVFMGRVTIQPGSTGFGNLTDAPDMGLIESEIQDAKDDAQAAKDAVTEAQKDVVELKDYVNGAFADGIITEAEATAIEKYINVVNSTSQSAEKAYNELYNNSYLEGSAKVSLGNAYSLLTSTIDGLINTIETAIADGRTTVGEKQAVDTAYDNFNQAYSNFIKATEAANKSIQDKLKGYSDNAQMAADEANNNASQAMEDANDAKAAVTDLNDYVDGAFADGIISETEAKAIATYINTVTATKKEVDATYTTLYSNAYLIGTAKSNLYSAKNSFNTATSDLIIAIQSAIADGKTTSSEKSNVDSKFTAFNNAYANIATAIENANKAIQDKIKEDAIDESTQNAIDEMNKVSEADKDEMAQKIGYDNYEALENASKRGETIIQGGIINTKLINAMAIVTSELIANAIKSKTLNINDKFIIETNGTVTSEGQHISKGTRTSLYMDDGFLRMTHDGVEVARLSVNQNTGLPTLVLSYGSKVVSVAPNMLSFVDGSKSIRFDPSQLGSGIIKKRTDGTLYIATQQFNYITISMYAAPTEGGRVSPYNGVAAVLEGSSSLVEAIPNSGYEFVRWSDGGEQSHNVVWSDGASLVAYFQKIQYTNYTITVKASPTYGGTVSGGGTKTEGSIGVISATPNEGYRFVRWSDGGMESHNVTWDSSKTLTAYFEAYSITGDEILLGTDLVSSEYWSGSGGGSYIVSVTGGVATMYCQGGDSIIFNKGYLGGKLEQGHRYRISIRIKANKSCYFSGLVGRSNYDADYGMFMGASGDSQSLNLTTVYKAFEREFNAYVDSGPNDGLLFITDENATIYIDSISLKEV